MIYQAKSQKQTLNNNIPYLVLMIKKVLVLLVGCFTTCVSFAQTRITETDKENFRAVVLSKDQMGVPGSKNGWYQLDIKSTKEKKLITQQKSIRSSQKLKC